MGALRIARARTTRCTRGRFSNSVAQALDGTSGASFVDDLGCTSTWHLTTRCSTGALHVSRCHSTTAGIGMAAAKRRASGVGRLDTTPPYACRALVRCTSALSARAPGTGAASTTWAIAICGGRRHVATCWSPGGASLGAGVGGGASARSGVGERRLGRRGGVSDHLSAAQRATGEMQVEAGPNRRSRDSFGQRFTGHTSDAGNWGCPRRHCREAIACEIAHRGRG
mmetsp:Transcript_61088/g.154680  ORF Transcript_61088/g.154680 Transcript_61088/m.154680 type:complete len:226 (+) Transcript_61088:2221-2898(+)